MSCGSTPSSCCLHEIAVDQKASDKIVRASGDGGDALSEQAAGAAFGDAEGRGVAKHRADDCFERIAIAGINTIAEQGFDGRADLG